MYVGSKIKQLRRKLNYTQAEFAEQLNVSQPYYSAIESGKKQISKKMLDFIQQKMGVSIEYFKAIGVDEIQEILGGLKGGTIGGFGDNLDYNSPERQLMSAIDENVKMITFLYQKIVDVRILLDEQKGEDFKLGYGGLEADMMNDLIGVEVRTTHTGDSIIGYKHDADDYKGKLEVNNKLNACKDHFLKVFFEEFKKLYRFLRKMD